MLASAEVTLHAKVTHTRRQVYLSGLCEERPGGNTGVSMCFFGVELHAQQLCRWLPVSRLRACMCPMEGGKACEW